MTEFTAYISTDLPTSEESAEMLEEKIEEKVEEAEDVEVIVAP